MEELLLHETREIQLELQITELEKMDWEDVLCEEKSKAQILSSELLNTRTKIAACQDKITEQRNKEDEFAADIVIESNNFQQVKKQWMDDDVRLKENELKTQEKIQIIEKQLEEMSQSQKEYEDELSQVEFELESVQQAEKEKSEELHNLQIALRDENLKDFTMQPPLNEDLRARQSGEGGCILGVFFHFSMCYHIYALILPFPI